MSVVGTPLDQVHRRQMSVEIDVYDISNGSSDTYLFTDTDQDSLGPTPHILVTGRVLNVEYNQPMFSSLRIGGGSPSGSAQVVLSNRDGFFDSWDIDKTVDNQTVVFKIKSLQGSTDVSTVFTGIGRNISVDDDTCTIQAADASEDFDRPIQSNLFKGWEGGLRGPVASGGTVPRVSSPLYSHDACTTVTLVYYYETSISSTNSWVFDYPFGAVRIIDPSPNTIVFDTFVEGSNSFVRHVFEPGSTLAADTFNYIELRTQSSAGDDATCRVNGTNIPLDSTAGLAFVDNGIDGFVIEPTNTGNNRIISELAIFNELKTAGFYDGSSYNTSNPPSGLIGYWKFAEKSGTTIGDSSSYGHDASGVTSSWVGSVEGQADLRGKPKPIALGIVKNITPPQVDDDFLIYQVHDGDIESIDAVYDSGAEVNQGNEQSTFDDLLDTAPTAGEYDYIQTTQGSYFRLGSAPSGDGSITCDVTGELDGQATAPIDIDGILDHIIDERLGNNLLVTHASSSLLIDYPPSGIGIYVDSEESALSVINSILAEISGFFYFGSSGSFTPSILFQPSTLPTLPEITLDEDTFSHRFQQTSIPAYRIKIPYKRNWTVQSRNDIAGSVGEDRIKFLIEPFRTVVNSDSNVQDDYPLASEIVVTTEGLIDNEGDALGEAERQAKLYFRKMRMLDIATHLQLLNTPIGDSIRLFGDRHGLSTGSEFVIIGKRFRYDRGAYDMDISIWNNVRDVRVTTQGYRRVTTGLNRDHIRVTC